MGSGVAPHDSWVRLAPGSDSGNECSIVAYGVNGGKKSWR